jgi:hypothetical protein
MRFTYRLTEGNSSMLQLNGGSDFWTGIGAIDKLLAVPFGLIRKYQETNGLRFLKRGIALSLRFRIE